MFLAVIAGRPVRLIPLRRTYERITAIPLPGSLLKSRPNPSGARYIKGYAELLAPTSKVLIGAPEAILECDLYNFVPTNPIFWIIGVISSLNRRFLGIFFPAPPNLHGARSQLLRAPIMGLAAE